MKLKNLWIIKASNLNRGQCIRVVDSLDKAHEIIQTFQEGITLQGNNKDKEENNIQINSMAGSASHIPPNHVFKTLVTVGKSNKYYVFVIPVNKELDLKKAAIVVNEKYVEELYNLIKNIHGLDVGTKTLIKDFFKFNVGYLVSKKRD